jgi:predicted nucleic acid-binding protein
VTQAVVDASVALAWVLPEEEAGPEAIRLLLAFQGNQVQLLAPSLWEYEVANALRVGVTRGRLTAAEGAEARETLFELGIILHHFTETADLAWELAFAHQLSSYDAAYLALAQHHNCPLYTADKRLLSAAGELGITSWNDEEK